MKEIELTQGQVALVDDEDFERINAYKWSAHWAAGTKSFYATRNSPWVNGKRKSIKMHRSVTSSPDGVHVDHINHDTLDNRRGNLRVCTGGQNQANCRTRADNTSGFKGVCWHRGVRKWHAYLMVTSKRLHLGYFTTALEAAIAYDRAALEAFGEFALTNQMLGLLTVGIVSNQLEAKART